MKARIDALEIAVKDLEQPIRKLLKHYDERLKMHENNNRIQSEFAQEINELNAQITQQARQLGEMGIVVGGQGVTLSGHEQMFKGLETIVNQIKVQAADITDIKKYIAISEDRRSNKRYIVDTLLKGLPIILTIIAMKYLG